MNEKLKHRIVGATVLVLLLVIFLPMILQKRAEIGAAIRGTNIPPPPVYDMQPIEELVSSSKVSAPSKGGSATALAKKPVLGVAPGQAGGRTESNPKEASQGKVIAAPQSWVIQVGSFLKEGNAIKLRELLRRKGFAAFIEDKKQAKNNEIIYRVRVGPEVTRRGADTLAERLSGLAGVKTIVVKKRF